ncbi:hypothetical protein L6452_03576 [Arctium lappa]|uniref:Uncharacterized protein n=1 Tax=Arctium lappa TaxID=4217 RepID=A0ACB9FNU1_ARCLA|nr:hypothetical protein L6452_03576 [Arctium lappa]
MCSSSSRPKNVLEKTRKRSKVSKRNLSILEVSQDFNKNQVGNYMSSSQPEFSYSTTPFNLDQIRQQWIQQKVGPSGFIKLIIALIKKITRGLQDLVDYRRLHLNHDQRKVLTLNIEEFSKIKELEAIIGDTSQKKPTQDDHLLISENPEKFFSGMESQLIRINKTEPWWRTVDLNDLASFVSDKSVENFDNSDLPRPQINKPGQWFVPDKGLASLDQVSNFVDSMQRSPTSVCVSQSHSPSGAIGCSRCGLDVPLRPRKQQRKRTIKKEHLITHFLKQASQLFAYKQWFHILQLETILRNPKYPPIYTCFPYFVPWVSLKGKQQKKGRRKPTKTKPSSPRYKIGKYFGSILLGLTPAALLPLLQHSTSGARIVNVSSLRDELWRIPNEQRRKELGDVESLSKKKIDRFVEKFLEDLSNDELEANGWSKMLLAYSVSKAMLNAYTTRVLAKMCINCVHPGYVDNDLNWHTGTMTLEEGAQGSVMLALLPQGGPSGCYFDRTQVAEF